MKITNLKKEENILTFTLEKSSTPFANALRRIMMSEVPVMAIDEVDFYENTASMFDEYLAHRLGLIPLTTDLKTYVLPSECCGGNCSKCSAVLVLEVEGLGTVYSKDLKCKDKKIKSAEGKIPIMKLASGQRLKLEAKAVLGLGKTHVKHQACLAYYKSFPIIEIRKECDGCGDCVTACPKKIIEIKNKKAVIMKVEECSECEACVEACTKNAISVSGDENRFLFKIESFGNLEPKAILNESLKILKNKVEEFEKKL